MMHDGANAWPWWHGISHWGLDVLFWVIIFVLIVGIAKIFLGGNK